MITANNVFAHADDLPGILDGVRELLEDEGFAFDEQGDTLIATLTV